MAATVGGILSSKVGVIELEANPATTIMKQKSMITAELEPIRVIQPST